MDTLQESKDKQLSITDFNKYKVFIWICIVFPIILFFISLFVFFGFLSLNSNIAHCEHIKGDNVTFVRPSINNTEYKCIYTNITSGNQIIKVYTRHKDVPWNQEYVKNVIDITLVICVVPCSIMLLVGFYLLTLLLLLQLLNISFGQAALLAIPVAILFPIFPVIIAVFLVIVVLYLICVNVLRLIIHRSDEHDKFNPDQLMETNDDMRLFEENQPKNKSFFQWDKAEQIRILYILTILLLCLIGLCFAGLLLSYSQLLDNDKLCCQSVKGMKIKFDITNSGDYECIYTNKTNPSQTYTDKYTSRSDIPWNVNYLRRYIDITVLSTLIPAFALTGFILFLTSWIMKIAYDISWLSAVWLLLKTGFIIIGLLIAGVLTSIVCLPISITLDVFAIIVVGPIVFIIGIVYAIYILYNNCKNNINCRISQHHYNAL